MNELKDPSYIIGVDPASENSESVTEAMRELLAQSVLGTSGTSGTSSSSGSLANVREAVWRAIRETAPAG